MSVKQKTGNKQTRIFSLLTGVAAIMIIVTIYQIKTTPHDIQVTELTLQQQNVGSNFTLLVDTEAGPSQKTLFPLPYQKQFVNGSLKYYMSTSALNSEGVQEIDSWADAHKIPVTNPPTILGSFVQDHHGIFAITSQSILYSDSKSAAADFNCCTYLNRQDSFANYQDIPVTIGNEATAFGGILDSSVHDPQYEVQLYEIRWLQGSTVSIVSIIGAHDIVFSEVLKFAQQQASLITQQTS